MSDGEPIACPSCGGIWFEVVRDSVIDKGHAVGVDDDLSFESQYVGDAGRVVLVRCADGGCGFEVAGDWDEFVRKVTLPDPAALLALRDRLSK